jgi:hypothetical protein
MPVVGPSKRSFVICVPLQWSSTALVKVDWMRVSTMRSEFDVFEPTLLHLTPIWPPLMVSEMRRWSLPADSTSMVMFEASAPPVNVDSKTVLE